MNSYLKVLKFTKNFVPILVEFSARQKPADDVQIKYAKEIKSLVLELGPTYVKFAQLLSVRYDIFDIPFCGELQGILDHGIERPYKEIRDTLVAELGEELFTKSFSRIFPEPIGVASLGQVHKAIMANGDQVAIKVLHTNVRQKLEEELRAFISITRMGSIVPAVSRMQLLNLIEEFQYWTLKETDYTIEAYNTKHFADIFEGDRRVKVPKVYWEVSTHNILVTELIEGISLKEFINQVSKQPQAEEFTYQGLTINKANYTKMMVDVVYRQIEEGFAHGDPHPSNLIITGENQISYIDFGIVAKISHDQQAKVKALMRAMALGDKQLMLQTILDMDLQKGDEDIEEIKKVFGEILEKAETSYASEYSIARLFVEVVAMGGSLGIQWPRYLVLVGKIVMTFDGIVQLILPDKNFFDLVTPTLEEAMIKDTFGQIFNPAVYAKDTFRTAAELLDLARTLPKESLGLVQDVRANGLPIRIQEPQITQKTAEKVSREKDMFPYYFLLAVSLGAFFGIKLVDPEARFVGQLLTDLLIVLSGMLVFLILFFSLRRK